MIDCIEKIAQGGLLRQNGLIVAEHSKDEVLPDIISGFSKLKERKYGTIIISIYS